MSSRRLRLLLPVVLVLGLAGTSLAVAAGRDHGKKRDEGGTFSAKLKGHEETPAIHTSGSGELSLTVNANDTLSFTLTYSGLSSPAQAAHVHFAQKNVNGGVSFFFCGGGGKPACPPGTTTPATVTGTVAPADVLAVTAQGLPAGNLDAIVDEMRAKFTYANVHTTNFPGGEIRGQLKRGHGHH